MNWPSIFPNPTGDFSGDNRASTRRLQFESGRYRQRRLYSSERRTFSAHWTLTDFQFGMFEAFLAHKLHNGADWFAVDLPLGATFKTVSARFVNGEYTARQVGGAALFWNVTAQLETDDAAVS